MKGTTIWVLFSVLCLLWLAAPMVNAGQTESEKILKDYEAADLNKDGYVDENEYKQYIAKEYEEKEKKEEKEKIEKNEPGQRQGEQFVSSGEEKVRKTKFKEFLNGRLRFFNEADANKDRLLSLQEYTRMMIIDPVK